MTDTKKERVQVKRGTDSFSRRIRFGKDQRRTFALAGVRSQPEADKVGDELEAMARRLTGAGLAAEAAVILDRFARAEQDVERARVRRLVDSLCSAELKIDTAKVKRAGVTFRALAARWTAGELAADFPDHVAVKKSADHDHARLEKVSAVALPDGGTFGDLPLGSITLDHCEEVMRSLPEAAKRAATRRHYAQVLRRVLELAVYPCRLIEVSPLNRNFMPKVGKPPAFSYLYPDEDRALLSSSKVPLCYRILWGFLAREGCRVSEAIQLRVGLDIDLERGTVSLDANKTNDARPWALDPGVTRALSNWVAVSKLERGALLFTDEFGRPYDVDKLAERLRRHLMAAGVDRNELHNTGTNRRRLRAHDLRGTFVTLSLANGKTEAWVQDRTGHKSSLMVNRYRRSARSAQELGLGPLTPLDQAIPELQAPPRELPKPFISKDEIKAMVDNAFRSAMGDLNSALSTDEPDPEEPEPEGGGQQGGQSDDSPNSPTHSADDENLSDIEVVAPSRLELERCFQRGILSPLRLPFRQGATSFLAHLWPITGPPGLPNRWIASTRGRREPSPNLAAAQAFNCTGSARCATSASTSGGHRLRSDPPTVMWFVERHRGSSD